MTKLFMTNGMVVEVSDSIKGIGDAWKTLNVEQDDIYAVKIEGDYSDIVIHECSCNVKCPNKRMTVKQKDWSIEAINKCHDDWEYNECPDEEDNSSSKTLYTFKECSNCGAGLQSCPVDKAPESYSYKEEYDDSMFYCIGTTTTAYCSSCGANAREW